MFLQKILLISSLLVCTNLLADSSAYNADEDGCWQANNYCIETSSKWSGKAFTSYYKNVCNDRIYIKFCNKTDGRYNDCGADGLRPGKRKSWRTTGDPTGEYEWVFVGSTKPSSDWVCSGKVRRWNDLAN